VARRSNGTDFLALWDQGVDEHPLDRAIGLVSAAEGIPRSEAAAMPIDARDRALFRFCAGQFGSAIRLVATCSECEADSEIEFSVSEVLALAPPPDRFVVSYRGQEIACRSPNSVDLAGVLTSPAPRKALLGGLIAAGEADDELLDAAEAALADRAGIATLSLANDCPECGAVTDVQFDILDYAWRLITSEARSLLRDIHVLARAYGWTSAEILALSPRRRAAHIAMVEA